MSFFPNLLYDAFRDLVQFKKRETHPSRSVTFSKAAGWTLLHRRFQRCLNCTNDTK